MQNNELMINFFQQDEIKELKSNLHQLEERYSDLNNLNKSNCKELLLLSSQLPTNINDTQEYMPLRDTLHSKDSLGSESPSEKFEIIDTHSEIFKKQDSTAASEDNVSNNSFMVSDWMNLTGSLHDSTHIDHRLINAKQPTSATDIDCRLFNVLNIG